MVKPKSKIRFRSIKNKIKFIVVLLIFALFSRSSPVPNEPLLCRVTARQPLRETEHNQTTDVCRQSTHLSSVRFQTLFYLLPGNKTGGFINLDKFLGLAGPRCLRSPVTSVCVNAQIKGTKANTGLSVSVQRYLAER